MEQLNQQTILDRRLAAYAVAAAAVGGATAAQGAIVYTPANDTFSATSNPVDAATVNMDNSGVAEFTIQPNLTDNNPDTEYLDLKRGDENDSLATTGSYIVDTSNDRIAALAAGASVGPGSAWSVEGTSSRSLYREAKNGVPQTPSGNFALDGPGNTQYIGVRFQLNGDAAGPTYYGWIGIDLTGVAGVNQSASGVMTGYAYDDSGAAIAAGATGVVPEPVGLAALALGAAGLVHRRRRAH